MLPIVLSITTPVTLMILTALPQLTLLSSTRTAPTAPTARSTRSIPPQPLKVETNVVRPDSLAALGVRREKGLYFILEVVVEGYALCQNLDFLVSG